MEGSDPVKSSPFDPFLNAVCSHVRYRPARAGIASELWNHLSDRTEAFQAQGLPLEEAEARAVTAMGDPDELGKALDRAHPCVWSYLYLVLRPVTVLICVLVFGSFLLDTGVLLYNMAVPLPMYDGELAVVRYAEPDLSLTLGDHHITIQRAYQLENGEVYVDYTDLIVPCRAYSNGANLFFLDEEDDWSYGGSYQSSTGNGLICFVQCQGDFDPPQMEDGSLLLRISASGQAAERTILLEEVNAP